MRRLILQRFRATGLVLIVPTVKRRSWHPDLFQRFARRQARLLDHPNNLEFFSGEVSHTPSHPSAIMLFFKQPDFKRLFGNNFLQCAGLATAQIGNAALAAQPVQYNSELVFSRIMITRRSANVG